MTNSAPHYKEGFVARLKPMEIGPAINIIANAIICGRCGFIFFVVDPEKNLTAPAIPCPGCFKSGANPLNGTLFDPVRKKK